MSKNQLIEDQYEDGSYEYDESESMLDDSNEENKENTDRC